MTHLPSGPALLLLDLDGEAPVPWTTTSSAADAPILVPLFPAASARGVTGPQLEALLASARHDGFLAGQEAARNVAEAALETRAADSLARIAAATAAAASEAEQVMAAAADAVAAALLQAFRTALPSLADTFGAAEAAHFAAGIVPLLRQELRVEVAVAPALVQDVAARLAADPRVHVQAGAGLAPGDATVRWTDGIAERRAADAHAAILDALAVLAGRCKQT